MRVSVRGSLAGFGGRRAVMVKVVPWPGRLSTLEPAAHCGDQRARLERADAEAAGLGRGERLEQAIADEIAVHAAALVADRDRHRSVSSPRTRTVTGSRCGLASTAFWSKMADRLLERGRDRPAPTGSRRRAAALRGRRACAAIAAVRIGRSGCGSHAAGRAPANAARSRASRSFILPTEPCSVATMSARNSGLSACRSALRASSDSWLTRFLMSWRMKAKRRLNSSNRCALASASWPCASASELAAWRPAVRSRSKSSQSSGRRYSGAASTTRPISRSWWISGIAAQAVLVAASQAGPATLLSLALAPSRRAAPRTPGCGRRAPSRAQNSSAFVELVIGRIGRRPVPRGGDRHAARPCRRPAAARRARRRCRQRP